MNKSFYIESGRTDASHGTPLNTHVHTNLSQLDSIRLITQTSTKSLMHPTFSCSEIVSVWLSQENVLALSACT